jgi:hypothetical protein
MESIFSRFYKGIIGLVDKDLRYQNGLSDLNSIMTDLKNYRIWMQSNEADIFIRCVRFFMDLDRDIVISPHEIYIIYALIIIRIMKNNIRLPYDGPSPV